MRCGLQAFSKTFIDTAYISAVLAFCPAATCVSINEEIVHGIPGPRELREGDIIAIDVGARYQDFVGDYARSKWADDARSNMVQLGRRLARNGKREYLAIIEAGAW